MNDPGFILDKDLAKRAVGLLRNQQAVEPGRPWFLYDAPGTACAPHQAPREWIDGFKGRFDCGWTGCGRKRWQARRRPEPSPLMRPVRPPPPEVPAWDSLPPEKQRPYARMMEVYAGALAFADNRIGTVLDEIARSGELDNTLVIFVQGDNGSSTEGGDNGLFNETARLNDENTQDYSVALANIDRPLAYGPGEINMPWRLPL